MTLGVINKVGKEDSKVVLQTQTKFVHENYDSTYLTSDIALLKLPNSVDISGKQRSRVDKTEIKYMQRV